MLLVRVFLIPLLRKCAILPRLTPVCMPALQLTNEEFLSDLGQTGLPKA